MGNSTVLNVFGSDGAYAYLWPYTLTVGFMLLSGVAGNLMIILVTVFNPALRNLTGSLVVNLAVADLFVLLTTIPFIIVANLQGGWKHGIVLCYAVGFAETFFTTTAALSMTLISYDRYTAIVKPNQYEDHQVRIFKRAGLSSSSAWILGFITATIPIFEGTGYSFNHVTGTCTVSWQTISFKAVCIIETFRFLVPLAVHTFSYGKIFYVVKRARRKIDPCVPKSRLQQTHHNSNSSEETYMTNTNSLNKESAAPSSTLSNTLSAGSYAACHEENMQTVESKPANKLGELRAGQTGRLIQVKPELLFRVNDVIKPVQDCHVITDTDQNIPYNMTRALSQQSKQRHPGAGHGTMAWQRTVAKKLHKRKAFRSMVVLYGIFMCSWVPYVVWTFCMRFLQNPSGSSAKVVFLLAISNCIWNAYIYGFVKSSYRKALKGCLKNKCTFRNLCKSVNTQVRKLDVSTISRKVTMRSKCQANVMY
ncbi:putative D(2) dopamine receptor-like [Apostichopus japonicus]|uniref:Putative D(2) dopamine receptor-like n=1 Tax=Stichopus japonicus TaxID=307972 RepID=A0A2G8KEH4_STIJA|nr:putative D(2) dopamine receptor-like [Apostichopus japonicus]